MMKKKYMKPKEEIIILKSGLSLLAGSLEKTESVASENYDIL